ncbi:MAG: ABC transporter ATP-binding protein [Anaerococcus sp.]|nr:ABC transporter ATP-binding protein [Anaerococcus sp.]
MKILQVIGVSKSYGGRKIIENINMSLDQTEITCLLGLSGVGKTTLFNIISGVESPDQGEILLNNEDISSRPGHISYMLQKDLLIEEIPIINNIILPMRLRGVKKSEAIRKARSYLGMFGLKGYEKSYPKALSGGMRQRAAFLRTYFMANEVLLLDEPFSALDALTKRDMHKWYLDISKKLKLSTIFISHDIDEALFLADKIYIMKGSPGKIAKQIKIDKKGYNFTLTKDFLSYKKQILQDLKI